MFHLKDLYSGLNFKWVAIGSVIDLLLTIIILIVASPFFLSEGAWELDEKEFLQEFDAMLASPMFLLVALIFGNLATIISAYITSSKAGTLFLKHGVWVAILSTILCFIFPSGGGEIDTPLWYEVLGWLFILPAGLLGGYFAKYRFAKLT